MENNGVNAKTINGSKQTINGSEEKVLYNMTSEEIKKIKRKY